MNGASSIQRRPIEALTGLRFVAALIVAVSHFPQVIPNNSLQVALARQGSAGVTIFFVLSGFVLTYNYADTFLSSTAGALKFLRARIARIWPMNVVSLFVTTLLFVWWANPPSSIPWVVNLLMLQSLVPTKGMIWWHAPAWSVSCELIFYCAFPSFLYWVLGRIHSAVRLLRLVVALMAVQVLCFCVVAVAVELLLHQSGRSPEEISVTLERIKFFPGLRMWEFFLGCVMGLAFLYAKAGGDGWWRVFAHRRARDAMVAASVVGLMVLLLLPSVVDLPEQGLLAQFARAGLYVVYTPLAMLLVTAIGWGPTAISPLLEWRWTVRLGEASYSFYMLQWSMQLITTKIADGAPAWRLSSDLGWWFSALAILVLVFISLATARWIEVPTRRFLRGAFLSNTKSY
ncbi:MAG: acyltransferase family protein [Hyphomicrobiaceae bacterium]